MRKALFPFALLLFLVLSSCKKEILPPPDLPPDIPVTYSDYPTNYLQVDNYWVYELRDNFNGNSGISFDSVSVESFIIRGEDDTFYGLTHRVSGKDNYTYTEYMRITPEGLLTDTSGGTLFDYSSLPVNTDSSNQRAYKCRWLWTDWVWNDTAVTIDGQVLKGIAKIRTQYPEDWCTNLQGSEEYIWARGIGLTGYNLVDFSNIRFANRTLQRFFVKH